MSDDSLPPNRRAFLGTVAAGTLTMAGAPLVAAASPLGEPSDPWLTALKGKHKQVFDTPNVNGGVPFAFIDTYLNTMTEHYQLPASEVNALLVIRYMATLAGLSDAVWARYKLGAMWNVTDPATKAPAERNIFINSRPGDIVNPAASIDRLMAKGVTVAVCGHAMRVLSAPSAANAGVSKEAALEEWKASLLPGMHVVPSGVLAVARAQEVGCTYLYGG